MPYCTKRQKTLNLRLIHPTPFPLSFGDNKLHFGVRKVYPNEKRSILLLTPLFYWNQSSVRHKPKFPKLTSHLLGKGVIRLHRHCRQIDKRQNISRPVHLFSFSRFLKFHSPKTVFIYFRTAHPNPKTRKIREASSENTLSFGH